MYRPGDGSIFEMKHAGDGNKTLSVSVILNVIFVTIYVP
jgi:hypothetical protein